jgi:hypothetical protein
MALFLDTSALVRRYVQAPGQQLVADAMRADDVWCASALCRSETLLALHRLAVTPSQHGRMWGRVRGDWDAFFVVPVDERCLAHAVELGPARRATRPSSGARSRRRPRSASRSSPPRPRERKPAHARAR